MLVATNMQVHISYGRMSNVRISLGYRTMNMNAHRLQARQFEAGEKKRKVQDLDSMIEEFRQMVINLDQQIISEQEKSGISDINHFAYPTFAKAAIQRRDNLIVSVEELEVKREQAQVELNEASEQLSKAEQLDRRETEVVKSRNQSHHTSHRF